MKVWYDWEFLEDGKNIIPISFGAVAEDGRECYLIHKEIAEAFSANKSFYWHGGLYDPEDWPWLRDNVFNHIPDSDIVNHGIPAAQLKYFVHAFLSNDGKDPDPELWGYCGSFDHVVTAWLGGRMVDNPEWFPYYTKDIDMLRVGQSKPPRPTDLPTHHALADAKYQKAMYDRWLPEFERQIVWRFLYGKNDWMTPEELAWTKKMRGER